MKYRNDPHSLVTDKPARGAVAQLCDLAFPEPFASEILLTAVNKALSEGMWLNLQRTDNTDEKIVHGLQKLGISLPRTDRASSTMDNHVHPKSRHSLNGYLRDVPDWFLAYTHFFHHQQKSSQVS